MGKVVDEISYYWWALNRWIENSDSQDWTHVCVVLLVVGVICMRGFKGRLNAR